MPIYEAEKQVGELLKSNIITDGKDEYYIYLLDQYKDISDAVMALALYLDRSQYSSSYIVNKSYSLNKKYSYNLNNKYYDKEWVKNHFDSEFYDKVAKDEEIIKDKLRHPFRELFHKNN